MVSLKCVSMVMNITVIRILDHLFFHYAKEITSDIKASTSRLSQWCNSVAN